MQWDYGKFILKQLDYEPEFSTSDSQLGAANQEDVIPDRTLVDLY